MRPSVPDVHITDSQDVQFAAYRALAAQAVLGLVFGLLAPLAMVDPTLWSIPLLGVAFSGWALRRIKNNAAAISGRKIAIAGLMFSLLFLAAGSADWLTCRWIVRQESREFSALWFKCLTENEPQKAFQLTISPQSRKSLDDRLWAWYRTEANWREKLEDYVKMPLVRTLLALGPGAQVRFYQVGDQTHTDDVDLVDQWYAVTYEEKGERKSFFVLVRTIRQKLSGGHAGWRITQTEGGGRPAGW